MGMTFAVLKQELKDRGFSDLDDTRAGRYINAARAELDRMYLWPWREKSATGTAPLAVADLGPIEAVTNQTSHYRLRAAQYADLVDCYGDLSTAGTPELYYRADPSGTPEIATYPTSTNTIGVQYWKVTPDISGTAEPLSPDEAHYLIVDMAVRRAYRDMSNHDQAEAVQAEVDRQIEALVFQYPPGVADDDGIFVGGYGIDW